MYQLLCRPQWPFLYIYFSFSLAFLRESCVVLSLVDWVVEFVSNYFKTLDLIDLIDRAGKVGDFQWLHLYVYPMHASAHIFHFGRQPTSSTSIILPADGVGSSSAVSNLPCVVDSDAVPIPSSVAMHWPPDSSSVGAARDVFMPTPRPSWYPE